MVYERGQKAPLSYTIQLDGRAYFLASRVNGMTEIMKYVVNAMEKGIVNNTRTTSDKLLKLCINGSASIVRFSL